MSGSMPRSTSRKANLHLPPPVAVSAIKSRSSESLNLPASHRSKSGHTAGKDKHHHHHVNKKLAANAVLLRTVVNSILGDAAKNGALVSNRSSADILDNAYQYSERILSSRLYPSVDKDLFQICQTIRKSLSEQANRPPTVRGQRRVNNTTRFEELHAKLMKRETITNKWAVLYLLYALSSHNYDPNSKNTFQTSFLSTKAGLPSLDLHTEKQAPDPTPDAKRSTARSKTSSLEELKSRREKAQFALRQRVQANTQNDVPENVLVRDLIFAFQGIDGKWIKFDDNAKPDGYVVDPKAAVTRPNRKLVRYICEIGWMYRRICTYVNSTLDKPDVGLVEQSFCGAIQHELTDYYRLIAVLESQLLEAFAYSAASDTESSGSDSEESDHSNGRRRTRTRTRGHKLVPDEHAFTLRRIYVWIQDPMERLRLLAMLTDAAKATRGGALCSAIGLYLQHGDSFILTVVKRIIKQTFKPIYLMIEKWITTGELEDPRQEFFVAVDHSVSLDKLWQDKYTIRKEMLPSFISKELANNILIIGKSLNFMRTCCQDSDALAETKLVIGAGLELGEDIDDVTELEKAVEEASKVTSKRLMTIMIDKFRIQEHCLALKKYLLLGQGDFIQLLMDLLHDDLSQAASTLRHHHAEQVLNSAIRGSNAQYEDPDVLSRITVLLMKATGGDRGYNIFSLDYKIDNPIRVVFTEKNMRMYLRLFTFLWRLKRVERAVSSAWGRDHARTIRALPILARAVQDGNMLRNEMSHFVHNLHNYMMFEVMECAWQDLVEEISKAKHLDELIKAHDSYLSQVAHKSLQEGGSTLKIRNCLTPIFMTINRFGDLNERLSIRAKELLDVRATALREAQARRQRGEWGLTESDQKQIELEESQRSLARRYLNQVTNTRSQYKQQLHALLETIDRHPSTELNYLKLRLDFNFYYTNDSIRNRRLDHRQDAAKATRTPRTDAATRTPR